MDETRKQHFVPQFLLRNFATGLSKKKMALWTYDKATRKIFGGPVENAGHENGFYEARSRGLTVKAEPLLKLADSAFAPIVQNVTKDSLLPETGEDRTMLSLFVALQMLRVPHTRNDMEQTRSYIISRFGPNVRWRGDDIPLGDVTSQDDRMASINMFQDVPKFARALFQKMWLLLKSPPGSAFIISDNPVVRHNTVSHGEDRGNLGIAQLGVDVYLPISRSHCLWMACPDYIRMLKGRYPDELWRRDVISGTSENVDFVNSLQISYAERFIYGREKLDFGIVDEMLNRSPNAAQPSSRRMTIRT